MSYCRFGEDSDVYVFGTVLNGADVIEVYTGNSSPRGVTNSTFNDTVHAALFLQALRAAGYQIPQKAIVRLLKEAEEDFPEGPLREQVEDARDHPERAVPRMDAGSRSWSAGRFKDEAVEDTPKEGPIDFKDASA